MDYRGKILRMSLSGDESDTNEYICTAHYAGHVEIVPTASGNETKTFPPIPLKGDHAGIIYDHRDDPKLVEEVKSRCRSRISGMLSDVLEEMGVANYESVHRNLERLHSLDGDQPANLARPTPQLDCRAAKNRACAACERPNCVGKLVFIEFPLGSDAEYDSGEFIVLAQSANSLYCVKTDSCLSGIGVGRIPFITGDEQIDILSVCEDDEFIREFIERLDDMDTENYEPEECDAAETVSRQLQRMLATKASPLDRLFKATDEFFGRLGVCSKMPSEFHEASVCT